MAKNMGIDFIFKPITAQKETIAKLMVVIKIIEKLSLFLKSIKSKTAIKTANKATLTIENLPVVI